jgi:transcriptional regulator with XRE-family HTH domain
MSISLYGNHLIVLEDFVINHILYGMKEKPTNLRKVLSKNLKKHREKLGISQEKLAESAEISTMMVKDIEGCRTWVSDKTLESLAAALKTDIYRLLMPDNAYEDEINKTIRNDLESITLKIRQDIDTALTNALKLW